MDIKKVKLTCYSNLYGFGIWDADIIRDGEKDNLSVKISERKLLRACGGNRRGTRAKPEAFLNSDQGKEWLNKYMGEN